MTDKNKAKNTGLKPLIKFNSSIRNYFTAPRSRDELIFELTRICVSLIFGVFGYGMSKFVLFQYKPFLGVPVVGEVLSACLFFSIIYYLMPLVLKASLNYLKQFLRDATPNPAEILASINRARVKRKNDITKIGKSRSIILLDTSTLIDGRILSLLELNFLDSLLIVPQFVLEELQLISDSSDKLKREKGRRGLEILEKIKSKYKNNFKLYPYKKVSDVDRELVYLARKIKAKVATVDYNLNKVADISKVKVLNINTLANALKTKMVPGDTPLIKIIKEGSGRGQGVGYLADGTMIIVNEAKKHIGKEVKITITKVLQTDAGLLYFADML